MDNAGLLFGVFGHLLLHREYSIAVSFAAAIGL